MKKGYLIHTYYLPVGNYKTSSLKYWHERLRINLAKWLFLSIKMEQDVVIKTTTGSGLKE